MANPHIYTHVHSYEALTVVVQVSTYLEPILDMGLHRMPSTRHFWLEKAMQQMEAKAQRFNELANYRSVCSHQFVSLYVGFGPCA